MHAIGVKRVETSYSNILGLYKAVRSVVTMHTQQSAVRIAQIHTSKLLCVTSKSPNFFRSPPFRGGLIHILGANSRRDPPSKEGWEATSRLRGSGLLLWREVASRMRVRRHFSGESRLPTSLRKTSGRRRRFSRYLLR